MPPPETARQGTAIAPFRAVTLTALAVIVGVLLLQASTRSSTPSTGAGTTTTTLVGGSHVAGTTTSAPASANVKVDVANGSNVNGAAGYFAGQLKAKGWTSTTAVNASTTVPTSAVYFGSTEQAAANEIANDLGVPPTAVKPIASTVPMAAPTAAGVIVIVGADLAAKVPASVSSGTSTA